MKRHAIPGTIVSSAAPTSAVAVRSPATAASSSAVRHEAPAGSAPARTPAQPLQHHVRIPVRRIVVVELRKSFDTRAGRWLLASVAGLAVLTTSAVIAFSPTEEFSYRNFTTAIAVPLGIVLPIIAALAVTAEWSQRSGLTTFTVVPHRGRVMVGKAFGVLVIAVPATAIALAVGALGTVAAATISGEPAVWNQDASAAPYLLLSTALTLLAGFVCGTLIRNSAGAIVAFFVYSFVIPPILGLLAVSKDWFTDVRPWVDLDYGTRALQSGAFDTQQWQQLATAAGIWLVVPLIVGMWTLIRSEVK
jgi:ABC-2 type transport system permease protein